MSGENVQKVRANWADTFVFRALENLLKYENTDPVAARWLSRAPHPQNRWPAHDGVGHNCRLTTSQHTAMHHASRCIYNRSSFDIAILSIVSSSSSSPTPASASSVRWTIASAVNCQRYWSWIWTDWPWRIDLGDSCDVGGFDRTNSSRASALTQRNSNGEYRKIYGNWWQIAGKQFHSTKQYRASFRAKDVEYQSCLYV